jgi:hypothetical protein
MKEKFDLKKIQSDCLMVDIFLQKPSRIIKIDVKVLHNLNNTVFKSLRSLLLWRQILLLIYIIFFQSYKINLFLKGLIWYEIHRWLRVTPIMIKLL